MHLFFSVSYLELGLDMLQGEIDQHIIVVQKNHFVKDPSAMNKCTQTGRKHVEIRWTKSLLTYVILNDTILKATELCLYGGSNKRFTSLQCLLYVFVKHSSFFLWKLLQARYGTIWFKGLKKMKDYEHKEQSCLLTFALKKKIRI